MTLQPIIEQLVTLGSLQVHNDLIPAMRKKMDTMELCYLLTPPPWIVSFGEFVPTGNVTRIDLVRMKGQPQ